MAENTAERVAHATMRGVVGAMAMTGMRNVTAGLGLLEEAPPRAILRETSKGLLHLVPRKRRRAVIELFHWGVGAQGGATFALLPDELRRARWAGPVYGLAVWAVFDAVLAPALGIRHAKKRPVGQRVALVADHLLYGFVLSETRARPQE
jgi:hypothetical protein